MHRLFVLFLWCVRQGRTQANIMRRRKREAVILKAFDKLGDLLCMFEHRFLGVAQRITRSLRSWYVGWCCSASPSFSSRSAGKLARSLMRGFNISPRDHADAHSFAAGGRVEGFNSSSVARVA